VAASDVTAIVVCDAGPVIHLDELNCLDLLRDFGEVLLPDVVWQEVQRHRPSALRRRRVLLTRIDIVPPAGPDLIAVIEAFSLDIGEEEALRLMQQFPEAILLTDDSAARAAAQRLNYDVHGSIGVLLLGWDRGRRSRRQLLNLLRRLPDRCTLHISRQLLDSIIARVQQDIGE